MEITKLTRDEKIALVRKTKSKYFSLRGKTPPELHMMEALIAACDVLELNETDLLESYKRGFLDGRLHEAKQAEAARGDTEIVGEEDGQRDGEGQHGTD